MNTSLPRFSRRLATYTVAAASFALTPLAFPQAEPTPPDSAQARPAAPPLSSLASDGLTVTLNGRSVQLSRAELAAMPQSTVTVHNAHTNADERYTGVALADLFSRLGLPQQHSPQQSQLLHSYIRAQGADFYFVLFSAVEVDRELHKGNVLVALQRDGQSIGKEGPLKLVTTEDALPMRSVHNLISLTLTTLN